ncbi:hypothetical protein [Actinoplanes sp. NPDC051494]|uniref:hypothetical protein n=1 Tax=Actinoplanes sp. NPDC051494 TaxID=3363907 RepID=UPI0037B99390
MVALIRYNLAAVLHGQRYVAPLLLFAVVLSVFTINDSGALTGSYTVSAGCLLVAMCWLTVTIVNHEDPVRRAIQAVAAGGAGRVLLAELLLALLFGAVLTVTGLIFPIVAGRHRYGPADLGAGALAELTCVCTGIAVGVLCSRLVVPRPGYSLLLALVVVIAVPLTPVPPVNPVLKLLSTARPAGDMLGPLTGYLAVSVVLAAACVTLTRFLAARRD